MLWPAPGFDLGLARLLADVADSLARYQQFARDLDVGLAPVDLVRVDLPGFQLGGVAAVDEYAAAADVQGNGIWIYSGPDQKLVAQGPLGTKLTHATSLGPDLAAFADTDGGAVYLERITPDISEVARIDAPGNPYGLAYDADRKLLLVTLTESNILRVVDVADPASPRIVADLPTVRQANSVAVDPRSGNVLVTGSDPGADSSLQIIPAESVDAP